MGVDIRYRCQILFQSGKFLNIIEKVLIMDSESESKLHHGITESVTFSELESKLE